MVDMPHLTRQQIAGFHNPSPVDLILLSSLALFRLCHQPLGFLICLVARSRTMGFCQSFFSFRCWFQNIMRTMSRSEPLPAGTLVGVFRSLSQRVEAADDWRSTKYLLPLCMPSPLLRASCRDDARAKLRRDCVMCLLVVWRGPRISGCNYCRPANRRRERL
jgi:hypothetical protein